MRAGHHPGRSGPVHHGQGKRSERGLAILELSLVMLLLFTFSAAIYDYGQAWRSGLTVNEAARAATRVGSAMGERYDSVSQYPADSDHSIMSGRAADHAALSSAKASLNSSGMLDRVRRVVVFNATDQDEAPASCRAGTSTSGCNIMSGEDFRGNWDTLEVTAATQTNGCLIDYSSCRWAPTSRDTDQPDAEYYGVYIEIEHDYMFPITGTFIDVSRTSIMRLEPKVR